MEDNTIVKYSFFDFCETIANFQTADAFVLYSYKLLTGKALNTRSFTFKVVHLLDRITMWRYNLNKRYLLYHLKNFTRSEIENCAESYYSTVIKNSFIPDVMNILIRQREKGYRIVLVSGGYDVYLRYFAKEFGVSDVISTRIKFSHNICQGSFWGVDCLGDNKVKLLNHYYPTANKCSEAYSDSKSDLPFLKWVSLGYVISKNKSQNWANENHLKEIIWTEKQN